MAMQPVFIVDDEHKKAHLLRHGIRACYCVNGLLRDLPSAKEALGIDIAADFAMDERPVQANHRVAQQLQDFIGYPIVVLTSPSEEGMRLADQVRESVGLKEGATIHITASVLDAQLLLNHKHLKKPVDLGLLMQARTRRIVDRLTGFLFTQYLQVCRKKDPNVYPAIDRYSAYMLTMLDNLEGQEPQYRLVLDYDNGFQALYSDARGPIDMGKSEVEKLANSLKGTPTAANDEMVPRDISPLSPLRLSRLVADAVKEQQKDADTPSKQPSIMSVMDQFKALFSLGYVTHSLPYKADPTDLNRELQSHFQAHGVAGYFGTGVSTRAGVIRPTKATLPPEVLKTEKKLAPMYAYIFEQTVNAARKSFSVVGHTYRFQISGKLFEGTFLQPPSQAMRSINFIHDGGPDFMSGSGCRFKILQANPPTFEAFLAQFDPLFCTQHILTSLHNLQERRLLYFEAGFPKLTEAGRLCSHYLRYGYEHMLTFSELLFMENAMRSIALGIEEGDPREGSLFFLHNWFHHFLQIHEEQVMPKIGRTSKP